MNPLHIGHSKSFGDLFLQDEINKHLHVIGASGTGKSKFLQHLMQENLKAGIGFALLDPHGTLYEAILKQASSEFLKKQIVLLNLSNPDYIIPYNPFLKNENIEISVQVSNMMQAIFHAWNMENSDQTPTLERNLRLCLTALIENNLTPSEFSKLINYFASAERDEIINNIESDLIKNEWQELQALKPKEWREELLSVKNRLFRFLTSKTIQRFMNIPNRSIDLLSIMDSGKILLVNLAKSPSLTKETARVFGSLLINEFFQVIFFRNKQTRTGEPVPYHLFIDEFQNFIGLDIDDMLDEARKFGLFLRLAHQRFGQIEENITDAVLTNCRLKAVFGGLSAEASTQMAKELFLHRLDPLKIKDEVYQTKVRHKYIREKVYGKSSSDALGGNESEGEVETEAYSNSHTQGGGKANNKLSGNALARTDFYDENLLFSTRQPHHNINTQSNNNESESSNTNYSDAESYSKAKAKNYQKGINWLHTDSESVSDVPFLMPEEYKELSSRTYYSFEEQLTIFAGKVKSLNNRTCVFKVDNTVHLLTVPFVATAKPSENLLTKYSRHKLLEQNAVSLTEVDQLQNQQKEKPTASAADEFLADEEATPPQIEYKFEKKKKAKSKVNLFDRLNKDLHNEDN